MEQSIPDLIYVQNSQGQPLMPTRRHNKVWYWLRKGMAKVVRREPFTIQLCFETTGYTHAVTVGVDTGSKTVGLAVTVNGEAVYQGEIHLRTDIADKLIQRRQYRRNRRNRKTRYRASRWSNRCRKAGWLPPSIRSKAEATVKAVRSVAGLLPVSKVIVEVGSFDTQKMQDPEVTGVMYQQGELFGYLVREYVLTKWKRTCCYCGATGISLQLEHIIPRSRGGSDRVSNLALACQPCNQKKGERTAAEFGFPHLQAQAKLPLKDAAHVSSLKTAVITSLRAQFGHEQVSITFGYETKYKRIQVLQLPKSHTNDALAVAREIGETAKPLHVVYHHRCIGRGNYQQFNGKHSEHKVWAPRKVRGFKLYEMVEAKGQVGYIAGRREKGAFVLKEVASGKKLLEVSPSKLRRRARPTHGWIMQACQYDNRKEGGASSFS